MAELARRTGIDASTFSRFKNDKANMAQLEPATITLMEEAAGLRYGTEAGASQFDEPEASLYTAEGGEVALAVRALKAGRNGIDPWVLNSRGLETAGYLPGDVVMVDLNAMPRAGDVVCAQVYSRGQAETIFRIYEEPFLVAATFDASKFKPLLVDNARVLIRGVVTACFRERRAA